MALTDQGHLYLAKITPAFDQIAQATEELSVPRERVVTLTTESTVAQKWLVPRLANLKKRHPDIDLRISVAAKVMDIEAHDFDVGLRYLQGNPLDGYDLLFPSIVRAYAAPSFTLKRGAALEPVALARGSLIEEEIFRIWPEWFKLAGLTSVVGLDFPHSFCGGNFGFRQHRFRRSLCCGPAYDPFADWCVGELAYSTGKESYIPDGAITQVGPYSFRVCQGGSKGSTPDARAMRFFYNPERVKGLSSVKVMTGLRINSLGTWEDQRQRLFDTTYW